MMDGITPEYCAAAQIYCASEFVQCLLAWRSARTHLGERIQAPTPGDAATGSFACRLGLATP